MRHAVLHLSKPARTACRQNQASPSTICIARYLDSRPKENESADVAVAAANIDRIDAIRENSRIRTRTVIRLTAMSVFLAACAIQTPRSLVGVEQQEAAQIAWAEDTRIWADASPEEFRDFSAYRHLDGLHGNAPLRMLALSGGADNGAFGAGFLVGWSETGRRPVFDVVTGVSAGALIAPLAFLGPETDGLLETLTVNLGPEDVLRPRLLAGILGGSSLADNTPLRDTIANYVTPELLAEVAEEYRSGRTLIIVTTNLDAQRAVLWDMGRIAAEGTSEALDLFRDVMLASTAIPGAFPPVFIETQTPDGPIREMHGDGGTATQILLVPDSLLSETQIDRGGRPTEIYAIVNGRLDPEFEVVKPRTFALFQRAASTLLKSSLRQQIATMRLLGDQPGIDVFVTAISSDFGTQRNPNQPFAETYTRALFAYGRRVGATGPTWQ